MKNENKVNKMKFNEVNNISGMFRRVGIIEVVKFGRVLYNGGK